MLLLPQVNNANGGLVGWKGDWWKRASMFLALEGAVGVGVMLWQVGRAREPV